MGSRDVRSRLLRRAGKARIPLTGPLADRLVVFLELLFRWNRKINLTGFVNADEAIDRLILEPLAAARHIRAHSGRLIDLGSGGGSPAIPLVLAHPELDLTMVEIKARKSAFLREAVRILTLERTVVETARYEDLLNRPGHTGTYTVASVRAVRLENATLRTIAQFLGPDGLILLFRGPSGPDALESTPPMEWAATHRLIESLGSRVSVFRRTE